MSMRMNLLLRHIIFHQPSYTKIILPKDFLIIDFHGLVKTHHCPKFCSQDQPTQGLPPQNFLLDAR